MYAPRFKNSAQKDEKLKFDDDTKALLKRIWRFYLSKHKKTLTISVLSMVIVALCVMAQARLVQPAFDYILAGKGLNSIMVVVIGFVVASILKGIFSYIQSISITKIGCQTIYHLQNQMFDSLIKSDIQHLDKEGTSKQLSRFSSDVHQMRFTVANVFVSLGKELFTVVGLFALCLFLNWKMTVLAGVVLPMIIIPVVNLGRRVRGISKDLQKEISEMTGIVDDALKGARQVKTYGRESFEKERSNASFARLRDMYNKILNNRSLLQPILETILGMTMGVIMAWGGYAIFLGETTVGTFMTFFVALLAAYQPVRSLATINSNLQEGLSAAKRVFDVIDTQPTIFNNDHAQDLKLSRGTVAFNNVSFCYDQDIPLLKNINITAKSNQTIALVGASGSGKTTILNLIPRFFDIDDGVISIDGQNTKHVTLESLRRHMAIVAQDTWMFNTTVFNNIAYGRENATHDDVVRAAKTAHAHDFIMALPQGYDTIVGERGLRLSGGQRQRIAIACAFLKDAPILLLDEATSSLDTQSERKVQQALNTLMQKRTTIVVAHRLSTIMNAHKIYVIGDGQIVEQGTHKSLMQKNGVYAKMHVIEESH